MKSAKAKNKRALPTALPATPVAAIPWARRKAEHLSGYFWLTVAILCGASVFAASEPATKRMLGFWKGLTESTVQSEQTGVYVLAAIGILLVTTFTLIGFAVTFPRLRSVLNVLPPAMCALLRKIQVLAGLMTLWGGTTVALLLGAVHRSASTLDWRVIALALAVAFAGKTYEVHIEHMLAQMYYEKYWESD